MELEKEVICARNEFITNIEQWDVYPVHALFMAKILFYLHWLKTKNGAYKKVSDAIAHCTFKPTFPNKTNVVLFEHWAGSPADCLKLLNLNLPSFEISGIDLPRHRAERWMYLPNRVIKQCLKYDNVLNYPNYRNFLLVLAGYSYLSSCFHVVLKESNITFNDCIIKLFKTTTEADILHSFRHARNAIIHTEEYENPSFNVANLLAEAVYNFKICYQNEIIKETIKKCDQFIMSISLGRKTDPDRDITNLALSGDISFFEEKHI